MKRREFIALISGAAVWPIVSRAQQIGKVYHIALVHPSIPAVDLTYPTFFHELRRLGYVEGQNLIVERYSGEGRPERYADLAQSVVRLKPDLIFASGAPMAAQFKSVTSTIPIITVTADPVSLGLATSVAHPGGNITGVAIDAGLEIWGKRLALLQEIVPTLSRAGFLATRFNWEHPHGEGVAVREAAKRLGIAVSDFLLEESRHEADYRRLFATISRGLVDGVVVSDEPENYTNRGVIVELVEKARLPAIYPWREHSKLGGLIAYAYDQADLFRHAAQQVDLILKGANTAETPFYQSARFELLINLKTAKALGITVPPALLARADEVIE
jgi:putative ABC transport system substrate-binding protein